MKSKVVSLYGDKNISQNEKYSTLLYDFIKPFEHELSKGLDMDDVIAFGMNAWNFGNMSFVLPKEYFQKLLSSAATHGTETALLQKMIDRKIANFEEHNLFIGDFVFKEVDGEMELTVTTEHETEFLEKLLSDADHTIETNNEEGYINRYAIIIKPQKPYFDWVASIDDLFMPDEISSANIYLVTEEIDDLKQWLKRNYNKFFALELENEFTDEKRWPQKRTFKMFQQWFDVDFSTLVYDLENYPVSKED